MKDKFDKWVASWSDGTLLIYFTALAVAQSVTIIMILG